MNTFQKIRSLASEKGLSIAQLERELNLSNGSISRWKNAAPSSKGLVAVADYFDVSVDYLLGRDREEYEGEATNEYRALQRLTNKLSNKDQQKAINILKASFEIDEDDDEDDI